MIGRIRAAWDDSRRVANTRRGTNPMSREEWFELQDRIANLVTGESMSIHLTDYRRHIERCIESQFRLHEARTRSDEPLTRSDVEAIAVNAAGDLIGKAFLGSASPTAPESNSRTVTGVLRSDDGDGDVREWNSETYEHTATRRTGMTPILGDGPITHAEASALAAELKEKLDELLASKYAHTRPATDAADGQGPDKGAERIIATGFDEVFAKTAPEADNTFPDQPLDKFIAAQKAQIEKRAAEYQEFLALRRPSAVRDETGAPPDLAEIGKAYGQALADALIGPIKSSPQADVRAAVRDELNGLLMGLNGFLSLGIPVDRRLRRSHDPLVRSHLDSLPLSDDSDRVTELLEGFGEFVERRIGRTSLRVGGGEPRHGGVSDGIDSESAHDSSPSADDGGAHSVGDGQVAGVETAAPVTDATASAIDSPLSAQLVLAGNVVIDVELEQNAFDGTVEIWIHPPDGGTPEWRTVQSPRLRLR